MAWTLACSSKVASKGPGALDDTPTPDFPTNGGCSADVLADCQVLGDVCDPSSGGCVECLTDADCAKFTGVPTCNPTLEICVECATAADCPFDSPGCGGGLCGSCNADGDCPAGQSCDGASSDGPGNCICSGDGSCGGDAPSCIALSDGSGSVCGCSQDSDCPFGPCAPPDFITHQVGFCAAVADGGVAPDGGDEDGGSGCAADGDCAGNPATPYCDLGSGVCVGCTSGSQCPGGSCDPTGTCVCSGTQVECESGCTDTTADPANCGGCGNPCAALLPSCCASSCTDLTSDPSNCGSCGAACGAPTSACCAGVCVDTTSNSQNCAGCGAACASGACVNSSCS